eukprot:10473794-Alexandrium_andersonii.AAC.1
MDRDVFDPTAEKVYGKFMKETSEIAVSLFCAFRACAEKSPHCKSKGKSVPNKSKPKPATKEPHPGNSTGEASSSGGVHEGA